MRIIILALLLAGCSMTKSMTQDEQAQTSQTRHNDIITDTFQVAELQVPSRLFAAMIRDYRGYSEDTSEVRAQPPPLPDEPVTITITKETKTQDHSVTTKDSTYSNEITEDSKTETKGIIGFGGGIFLAFFVIVVLGAWVIIRFYF